MHETYQSLPVHFRYLKRIKKTVKNENIVFEWSDETNINQNHKDSEKKILGRIKKKDYFLITRCRPIAQDQHKIGSTAMNPCYQISNSNLFVKTRPKIN